MVVSPKLKTGHEYVYILQLIKKKTDVKVESSHGRNEAKNPLKGKKDAAKIIA